MKYNFLVKVTKEIKLEIEAENHSKAMQELLQKIVEENKKFLDDGSESKKEIYIKVDKIIDEKGKENEKNYEEFMKENDFFFSKFVENIDENFEKIGIEVVEKNDKKFEDNLL